MTAALYWLALRLLRLVLPLYARVEVRGRENVPRRGAVIIASNHLNDGDPPVLAAAIPRRIVFMAKAEFFRLPVLGRLARLLGAFPVRRNQADLSALRQANAALKRGLALGIFPEGGSSTSEARLQEAWPGAALVALRGGVPLLPVAITGSQQLRLPHFLLRPLRRAVVTLTIGEAFQLQQPQRLNTAAVEAGTAEIMARIAALLPPEYRGYYGSEGQAAGFGAAPPP